MIGIEVLLMSPSSTATSSSAPSPMTSGDVGNGTTEERRFFWQRGPCKSRCTRRSFIIMMGWGIVLCFHMAPFPCWKFVLRPEGPDWRSVREPDLRFLTSERVRTIRREKQELKEKLQKGRNEGVNYYSNKWVFLFSKQYCQQSG